MTIIAPLYITQSPKLETALKTKNRVQSMLEVAHCSYQVRGTVLLQKWKPEDLTRKPNSVF